MDSHIETGLKLPMKQHRWLLRRLYNNILSQDSQLDTELHMHIQLLEWQHSALCLELKLLLLLESMILIVLQLGKLEYIVDGHDIK